MSIGQSLLPEFDAEMAATRKVLAEVPEAHLDSQPHEKSMASTASRPTSPSSPGGP